MNLSSENYVAFLLAFIPALINIGLAIIVFSRKEHQRSATVFLLMIMSAAIWQLGAAMVRVSATKADAVFWDELLEPFGLFGATLTLHFVLMLVNRGLSDSSRRFLYLAYFATFLLVGLYPTLNESNQYIHIPFWGWVNLQNGTFNAVVGSFLDIQYFITIYILTRALIKTKRGSNYYYQLLLLDVSLVTVIIASLIAEGILPLVFHHNPIPITATTILVFTAAAFIAMFRFRLFQPEDHIDTHELMGMISDAVLVVNSALEVAFVNERTADYTKHNKPEILNNSLTRFLEIPEIDKGLAGKDYFKELIKEGSRKVNGRLITSAGEKIPVITRISVLKDDKKNAGAMLICRDITESDRAEEEIRKNERRFKKIIQRSKDTIALINREGTITYITPSVYHIIGYEPEELIGKNFLEFIDESARKKAADTFVHNSHTKDDPIEDVFTVKHKSGRKVWVESIGINHLDDPDINALVAVFRDVSRRVHAEQEASEMTRLLEEAQEMSQMGNWIAEMKEDGNSWWSNEALRIYGMTPEEFDGKSATYFRHVHPEDLALMYSISGQAIEEHKPFSVEHRIVLNDGTVKWVHNHGYAEYDTAGVPVKLIGTVQDITERKLAEKELIKKNEELTLINSELDRFVYSASHDIRSPLMSILGIINIAEDETKDPVALEYFKMIERTALKLDEFTLEIIYWSRNRRLDTIPDVVEVAEMVHGVIDSLKHQKIARNVTFIVEAKEYIPFVTDKLRLRIILYNLIANGILYQKPGNEQGYVKIVADVDNKEVLKIEVEDNGIGIEEDNISKIFEMFTRLSDSSHGSGLGLYIVKEAVEKIKGSIEVSSSVGVGTKFTVTLPVLKELELIGPE